MGISSMFSVLRRNSLMPLLLLIQVALACAILCNVSFMVWQKLEPMMAPSGVDTDQLILVSQVNSRSRPWSAAEVDTGTRLLRRVPGVKYVSAAQGLPMVTTTLMDYSLQGSTGAKVGVNAYMGKDLLKTLGLDLVAGRGFLPSEYAFTGIMGDNPKTKRSVIPIIITQALARKVFDGPAVGKLARDPEIKLHKKYRVVGVVRHLLRNQLSLATNGRADYSALLPSKIGSSVFLSFAVRVAPTSDHAAVLKHVQQVVRQQFGPLMGPDANADVRYYNARRKEAFSGNRAALWLFAGVTLAVIIVTIVGIMGLTGFWLQKRVRYIGIRRALGARRVDILRQFSGENLMIVGAGVIIGMALAYVVNAFLMRHYELHRLPWMYLPLGAGLLLVVGQLAVLSPALRAARVPPVVATRTV